MIQLMAPESNVGIDLIALPSFANPVHGNNVMRTMGVSSPRPDRELSPEASQEWDERLAHLKKPLTAVIVGGDTKDEDGIKMTKEEARDFGKKLAQFAEESDTSLFLVTSPRTSKLFAKHLAGELIQQGTPHKIHYWQNIDSEPHGMDAAIQKSDNIIATGDSMSMLYEAAHTPKPLYIHVPESVAESYPGYMRAHQELYDMNIAKEFDGTVKEFDMSERKELPNVGKQIAEKAMEMIQERAQRRGR